MHLSFDRSSKDIISTSTFASGAQETTVLVPLTTTPPPPLVQVVKDRVCLRALEKIIHQLADSKEQAEILSASALQPVDVNADGTQATL